MGGLKFILLLFVLVIFEYSVGQNVPAELKQLKKKLAAQKRMIMQLTGRLQQLEDKVGNIDEAKGQLSDYPACPNKVSGFHYIESLGSCYKLEPNSLLINATQAETHCQGYDSNSHLVAIQAEDEHMFLRAMWKNAYGISTIARFWTSGKMEDGDWTWASTGQKFKYEHWIPTTDHNDSRFQCLGIFSNEGYFWGDVACWAPHVVTCEINI